jgi:hypothetical protein
MGGQGSKRSISDECNAFIIGETPYELTNHDKLVNKASNWPIQQYNWSIR